MGDPPNSPTERDCPIEATIDGNRFEVIAGGGQRREKILEVIGNARESLRLVFYIFNSDEAGTAVRDALAEAARRGVKVRLLLDGYGCSGADPGFFQPIDDAGGRFCLFHPRYGRRYLVRNHQKLVVADDRVAIIGGANIHNSYLTDRGERHWRDLWMVVDGPIVAHAARYFDALYRWTTGSRSKLRTLRRLVRSFSQSRGALQWKFSGPLTRKYSWPAMFARELLGARSVEVIAAYLSPPRSLLRRFGQVARRGGKVRIITASRSDNNTTVGAARHNYRPLLRWGVETYEYQPARLHTKLAIVDDVVHIGSANLDFRSVYINMEIMLRIEDAAFARQMRDYFEQELALSERVTPELHRRRATLWNRAKWTLSHWLVTAFDYTVTRRLNFREL